MMSLLYDIDVYACPRCYTLTCPWGNILSKGEANSAWKTAEWQKESLGNSRKYLMCCHVICDTVTYAERGIVDATHGTAVWVWDRCGHAALNFVSFFGEILNNTIKTAYAISSDIKKKILILQQSVFMCLVRHSE